MTTQPNFPVTVTFNPNAKEVLMVNPHTVPVNVPLATVTWQLVGPPGSSFDPTDGIVWNPGVVDPPGTPSPVNDTQWTLLDTNTNFLGPDPVVYKYTIHVIGPSGSHFRDDPEVENDPTGG